MRMGMRMRPDAWGMIDRDDTQIQSSVTNQCLAIYRGDPNLDPNELTGKGNRKN
jgi:hypothetical protein